MARRCPSGRSAGTFTTSAASLGDVGEVFVPLISDAGVEAAVDWGQAKVLSAR